jgi:hypothetical protein
MSFNISGFGLSVNLIASTTYPIGLNITEFADDANPLDVPSLQIGDVAMGLNGDLITWSKANPIKITLNVIPDSDNDLALSILLAANRVGRGKSSARDNITMNVFYPNQLFVTLINGVITDGMPFVGVANSGRMIERAYNFSFENYIGI